MARKIGLICLAVIALLIAAWFFPVRGTVKEDKFNIMDYADEDNIAVVCEVIDATSAYWVILDSSDPEVMKMEDNGFDTVGNSPYNEFRYPMYYYPGTKFILVGNFIEDKVSEFGFGPIHVFDVEKWYILGDVDRGYFFLPRPKSGLNFTEIVKSKAEE